MRLLLISNSTNAGEPYLEYPMPYIAGFLGKERMKCAFIPYAGVTVNFDDYVSKVAQRFAAIGQDIISVHSGVDPLEVIESSDVIVVGGGNTFQLLKMTRENGLIEAVRKKVLNGTPYIGWSAGANMACPTIRTTNDMPIVEPDSFNAFGLIPFQINPHYLDANPEGHAGETREARIEEFIHVNREITVAGLREGCMFQIEGRQIQLLGKRNVRIFKYGFPPREMGNAGDFNFLLETH